MGIILTGIHASPIANKLAFLNAGGGGDGGGNGGGGNGGGGGHVGKRDLFGWKERDIIVADSNGNIPNNFVPPPQGQWQSDKAAVGETSSWISFPFKWPF